MPFTMSGVSVEAGVILGSADVGLDDTILDQNSPVRAMLQSIAEITVEVNMASLAVISITMTPTYDDAIKILRSGLMGIGFIPDNTGEADQVNLPAIKIRVGYDGGLDTLNRSPWYYGGLTIPSMDFGEEITLTMHAHSGLYYAQRLETEINALMSGNDFLQQIANKFNIVISIADTNADAILSAAPEPIIIKGDLWTALRDYCYRKRLIFYFGASVEEQEATDNIIISSRKGNTNKQPSWQFVMYEQINPSGKVIPISRYHVDASALALAGAAFGGVANGTDTKTKKSITQTDATTSVSTIDTTYTPQGGTIAPDGIPMSIQEANQGGGPKQVDKLKDAGRKSSQLIRDNVDTSDMEAAKVAENIENTLEFTVEVPLLPGLLANDLIDVRIAGLKELSGVAQVLGFTHRIGTEATTEVKLSRALGTAPADAFPTNTQQADTTEPVNIITPSNVPLG